jgi:hypothetical protein
MEDFRSWCSSLAKSITIEPVILLFIFGNYVLLGAQVPTNLLEPILYNNT